MVVISEGMIKVKELPEHGEYRIVKHQRKIKRMRREEGGRVLIVLTQNGWGLIASVATAVTAIVALLTVFITLLANKQSRNEKHLSVQPWFHITGTSGARSSQMEISIINDGYLNVSIQGVELIFINGNRKEKLEFKYVKMARDSKVGKYIEVFIPWSSELYGQPIQIKISYLNLYKKKMESYSGRRIFVEQLSEGRVLEFEEDNNFFRPFTNTFK